MNKTRFCRTRTPEYMKRHSSEEWDALHNLLIVWQGPQRPVTINPTLEDLPENNNKMCANGKTCIDFKAVQNLQYTYFFECNN